MHDSFFSTQNEYDKQLTDLTPASGQRLIEASVRRIIRNEGAAQVAGRLYRLADICATANVVPLGVLMSSEHDEDEVPPGVPARTKTNVFISMLLVVASMAAIFDLVVDLVSMFHH
jgi:hypothetical protein